MVWLEEPWFVVGAVVTASSWPEESHGTVHVAVSENEPDEEEKMNMDSGLVLAASWPERVGEHRAWLPGWTQLGLNELAYLLLKVMSH